MGKVTIRKYTPTDPLEMIGESAGICWDSQTDDKMKNIKRAIDCYYDGHGRTLEFPDVYLVLEGYSARVIREWYTHLGGAPTRLQSSTRYVNAENFKFITPSSIENNKYAKEIYPMLMSKISEIYSDLLEVGVPQEDAALILPLGMETTIVDKRNLRNLIDMSRQRMCTRAYWEYRQLFNDIKIALSEYSPQWKWLVENTMFAKCELNKSCPEKRGCGKYPKSYIERKQYIEE